MGDEDAMGLKYAIINASEVSSMDFSQLSTTSQDTMRYNVAEDKAIVKFTGNTPSFLSGKTIYSHSEILTVVNNTGGEWYYNEEE